MIVSVILFSLGMIMMGFFIYGKITNYSTRTIILKSITSSLFVALAVYLFVYKGYPNVGVYIIIGAFFGLLGDVALGLKRIYPNKVALFTMLGFLGFAVGHIIYVLGLYINFYIQGHFLVILIPIIISLLAGGSVFFIEKVLKVDFKKYKPAAVCYVVLLSSLGASSLAICILYSFQSIYLILMSVGGVLFASSDIILSKTYFGSSSPKKSELISCSITYYLAQFIIAFSLFFL